MQVGVREWLFGWHFRSMSLDSWMHWLICIYSWDLFTFTNWENRMKNETAFFVSGNDLCSTHFKSFSQVMIQGWLVLHWQFWVWRIPPYQSISDFYYLPFGLFCFWQYWYSTVSHYVLWTWYISISITADLVATGSYRFATCHLLAGTARSTFGA